MTRLTVLLSARGLPIALRKIGPTDQPLPVYSAFGLVANQMHLAVSSADTQAER